MRMKPDAKWQWCSEKMVAAAGVEDCSYQFH